MDRLEFSHNQPLTDAPALETSAPPSHYHASSSSSSTSPSAPQASKHAFLPPAAGTATPVPINAAACEIKPRLTKDQHDILEREYQRQNKPNTSAKKLFAEMLGVTLDKVNNWFQNRRAKAKSDAKKAAEQENLYQEPQEQPQTYQPAQESRSDSTPALTNEEIINSMDQWAGEGLPENSNVTSNGSTDEHAPQQNGGYQPPRFDAQQFLDLQGSRNLYANQAQTFFETQQDINRRTLTQEQFDAFTFDGGFFDTAGNFQTLDESLSSDHNGLGHTFFQTNGSGYKHHDSVVFPYGPLPNYDASPDISNQTILSWPSANLQNQASANSPDHSASRASSLSYLAPDEPQFPSANVAVGQPQQQPQPNHSSSQWQPGQSVPIDVNALNESFRQAAAQSRPSQPRLHSPDQVIGWPSEDAALRRGSSTSLLAQSLSNVGIHTPQPASSSGFKSPAPPSNIAARRQRTRPAALGLTALRSQSYSDGPGPATAGPTMQHANQNGAPGLRRIRSSNVVNGVAQGRVMKSIPGSAQRSPLHFQFPEAMHSPKFARQFSASEENLTPPSPSLPSEHSWSDQNGRFPLWPSMAAQAGHQPSTSDAEAPAGLSFQSLAGVSHTYSGSPPHTPHHSHQTFAQQLGRIVFSENTPPQSAPATQQTFPSGLFSQAPPPPPPSQAPVPAQPNRPAAPQTQQQSATSNGVAAYPQHHFMNVIVPEQHQQAATQQQPGVSFPPQKQFTAHVSGPTPPAPIQFANGVPTVDADGKMQMTFQNQPAHFAPDSYQSTAQGRPSPPYLDQGQGLNLNNSTFNAPAQTNYHFVSGPGSTPYDSTSPSAHFSLSTMQPPPPKQELQVQEYTPPADLKSSSSPLRPIEFGGPRNYTFSNHTSQHFENGKGANKTGGGSSGGGSAPSVSSGASGDAFASPASSQGSSAGSSAPGNGVVASVHLV